MHSHAPDDGACWVAWVGESDSDYMMSRILKKVYLNDDGEDMTPDQV